MSLRRRHPAGRQVDGRPHARTGRLQETVRGRPTLFYIHEFFYPLMQGTGLGGRSGPTWSWAAPTRSSTCCRAVTCSAMPGRSPRSADDAHRGGAGRRPEDVQVPGQLHRAGSHAGRDVRPDNVDLDKLILTYFTYFTDVPQEEIERIRAAMAAARTR